MADLTSQVTWSVTSTSGLATFDRTVHNQLNLVSGEGSDKVTITATLSGTTGTSNITTSF